MLSVYTYKFMFMLVRMDISKCQYCQRTHNKLKLTYSSGYGSLEVELVHHRQWGRAYSSLGTSLACTSLSLRGTCTFLDMETSSSYAIKLSLLCQNTCMQRDVITFDLKVTSASTIFKSPRQRRQRVKLNSIHNSILMLKCQEPIPPCFTHASIRLATKDDPSLGDLSRVHLHFKICVSYVMWSKIISHPPH